MSTRTRDMADRVASLANRIESLVDQRLEDHRALGALMRAEEALEPVVERLEGELSAPTRCECGSLAECVNCICCKDCCVCAELSPQPKS